VLKVFLLLFSKKAVKKQANNKTFEERHSDKLPSSFYILFKLLLFLKRAIEKATTKTTVAAKTNGFFVADVNPRTHLF
jgi:hypothetical protein